jgi:hypothetical protein
MPTSEIASWSLKKLEPKIYPDLARTMSVKIKPAAAGYTTKLARGTVLGEVTATGTFAAYTDADSGSEGLGVARAILVHDIVVDENGAIAYTATTGRTTGEHGETFKDTPVYIAGCFSCADLVGLDANAVADLGRLVQGTYTAGLLSVA